ncbi:YbjN domain-containing protein [Micromonospora fluostatini]|uniref:YbjN domain-containing protein n=1 Tax=Micromonospora sp. JCM 30529 TaxID=3421643 RepID=UPI003D1830C1
MTGPAAWRDRATGRGDQPLAEALADARDLPDGPGRADALERVARRADATGDTALALRARFELIETYLHRDEGWRLFEPVRRCLDLLDRAGAGSPATVDALRRYQRYAVEALLGTPRVALDQARSMLDELAARSPGDDGPVVAELRCRVADQLGDEPDARHWYARWRDAAGTDPAGGCPHCLPVRRADLLAGWGDPAGAVAELEPVLAGGAGCADQPAGALAVALLPWLRLGATQRAAAAHVRAYRRHRRGRAGFGYLAAHLRFCALSGNPARGLEILAEQVARLDRAPDDRRAMEVAAAGALVCAVAVEAGLGGRTIHRPGHGSRPAADLDVGTLGGDLLATATALAGSFDARNGTGHQSGRIAAWLAERPVGPPVPLPPDDPAEPADAGPDADSPAARPPADEEPVPLSLSLITGVLDGRGDGYAVDATGTVLGRWGPAVIQFSRVGDRGDVLQARVAAERRLPAERRAEAYAFCNAWNHDRLLPRAYVHDLGNGELVLAGDVTTDLGYGVAPVQVAVLVDAAVATGVAYADAVATLP